MDTVNIPQRIRTLQRKADASRKLWAIARKRYEEAREGGAVVEAGRSAAAMSAHLNSALEFEEEITKLRTGAAFNEAMPEA